MSKFNLSVWEKSVLSAVEAAESSGVALTKLVREGRDNNVDEEKAREVFQAAYAATYAKSMGVTEEEARKSKSYRNRVSDCMAVFKADAKSVAGLVGSVQTIAAKVRKANAKPGAAQPGGKSGTGPKEAPAVDASEVKPLALLNLSLEQLAKLVGEDKATAEAYAALVDAAQAFVELVSASEAPEKNAA